MVPGFKGHSNILKINWFFQGYKLVQGFLPAFCGPYALFPVKRTKPLNDGFLPLYFLLLKLVLFLLDFFNLFSLLVIVAVITFVEECLLVFQFKNTVAQTI